MAYEVQAGVSVSFKAGEDLSSAQFKFVKLDSSGEVVACTAVTDIPIGVLQNTPTDGQIAQVAVSGGTKVKAGGTAAPNDLINVSASATAVKLTAGSTGSTSYVVGRFLADAAAGATVSAVIDCANPARGA
jgi:hypothetical protein